MERPDAISPQLCTVNQRVLTDCDTRKGRKSTRDDESGVLESDGTLSISFNPAAAGFLLSVFPGGVASEAGEFCCLRYSWRVRLLRTERRDEAEEWRE